MEHDLYFITEQVIVKS